MGDMKGKPDEFWKEKLTSEQYHIVREKGTEPAFSGKYVNNHETGMYECVACGAPLFSSDAKFDSGTGWPSFDKPENTKNIELRPDHSFLMERTEVVCKNCGAHLGHLFDDGPKETTGKRYCINSCALNFKPKAESGFVPLLVLGAVFMVVAVLVLALSSVKLGKPIQQSTLSLPQSSSTNLPQAKAQPQSTPTLELPKNPNQDTSTPSQILPSFVPSPALNSQPVTQNQTTNTPNNVNLNFLAAGAVNIVYSPSGSVEVLIYPLSGGSSSLDRVGNVSYTTILPGKYLLHFSNPYSLGIRLPNDTEIEVDSNKTTLINVNLIDGTLTTSFGWAP